MHVQGEARVLVETMRNGTEKQRLQLAKALSVVRLKRKRRRKRETFEDKEV